MKRPLGFSTGSLAGGDYKSALDALQFSDATAVELSALREEELEPLMRDLPILDLAKFGHISVHAPSQLSRYAERDVVRLLKPAIQRSYPIIVHADVIKAPTVWGDLGKSLVIENMDKRKPTGRTAREIRELFGKLPIQLKARLCLDLAHSRQVDPSLCETIALLVEFRTRVAQIHLSELNSQSKHEPLSFGAIATMRTLTNLLPPSVAIILEFASAPHELNAHLQLVDSMLRPEIRMARNAG